MHHYAPLPTRPIRDTVLSLPHNDPHAQLTDPAEEIFTDFRVAPCVVVPSGEPLEASLRLMQLAGVRMAFVTEAGGGVVGLVTAADLGGERPMQIAMASGRRREELGVADVMTAVPQWNSMEMSAVAKARVGNIVATFQATGHRYLIVTDSEEGASRLVVRGLFSASRAERALGHSIEGELRSRNFSELAAALSHS
jgi:hypothetical protein